MGRGSSWPDGTWRTPDSVQRADVAMRDWVVGDPLTPGWASNSDAKRIEVKDSKALPKIPSLPLSWEDAQHLLKALKKTGLKAPESWQGDIPKMSYFTGNSSESPTVHLMNLQDEVKRQPVRNIIGRIEGREDPKKEIYIGNHRDAWCFGAINPGSGTAVFLEVVRLFGELLEMGWRPRRTLVFVSWDAADYNLIGSTEHVEDRLTNLRHHGIAYLNVETGVSGSKFRASGSPLFNRPLLRVLDRVGDPTGNNVTLKQRWREAKTELGTLGTSSDYVPFQHMAGMSSLDIGFEAPYDQKFSGASPSGENIVPHYPRGSCYDSMVLMQSFIDKGLFYHSALAQVWGLVALELADEPILGFDFESYAKSVRSHLSVLKTDVESATHSNTTREKPSWKALDEAVTVFEEAAAKFMKTEQDWHNAMLGVNPENAEAFPGSTAGETEDLTRDRISRNAFMSDFESHLLDLPMTTGRTNKGDDGAGDEAEGKATRDENDKKGESKNEAEDEDEGGLPGRAQFKHVLFGPPGWGTEYKPFWQADEDASTSTSTTTSKAINFKRDPTPSPNPPNTPRFDDPESDSKHKPSKTPAQHAHHAPWFPFVRDALVRQDWGEGKTGVQGSVDLTARRLKIAAEKLAN